MFFYLPEVRQAWLQALCHWRQRPLEYERGPYSPFFTRYRGRVSCSYHFPLRSGALTRHPSLRCAKCADAVCVPRRVQVQRGLVVCRSQERKDECSDVRRGICTLSHVNVFVTKRGCTSVLGPPPSQGRTLISVATEYALDGDVCRGIPKDRPDRGRAVVRGHGRRTLNCDRKKTNDQAGSTYSRVCLRLSALRRDRPFAQYTKLANYWIFNIKRPI